MKDFYVSVGQTVTFSKTVSESDVYLFAGITGDLAPVHVNQALMERSAYGQRIAHGALLVGFMSTLSTLMVAQADDALVNGETPVALGYDRIRFTAPVFFGDTITLTYTITAVDTVKRRSLADIEAKNQRNEIVAVATGLLKWVRKED
ncbi:MaoC/PaaZ C-terminal domain-containing protein [Neorhizobium sp. CSC1952]|uniref:MaoC/PaaZ C-terminal domain-containing protein n=1 Tax=Neorhizobium sp. CSC1952 TaxID=2978974 RepID=UPI0025A55B7C|nr:MaoC/PaaZ C-terminal domain-containing protein [Rhizobium sp. CSC1952]WJR65025.1 MaoC/PaaZ C-terminal domain-containing protein [Rhizobium sp. CSC1952]